MNSHRQFEKLLKLLVNEQVEFVVVGGQAAIFHGHTRKTHDLDLFFRGSEANIGRLRKALGKFGLITTDQQAKSFADPRCMIRVGEPSALLEMFNKLFGVTFDGVWMNRVPGRFGSVDVFYISLPDLIANKKAVGRPTDLADIDHLSSLCKGK